MSDTVIRVENLGKKYVIEHQKQEKYTSLRDVIANGTKSAIKKITNSKSTVNNTKEEFWALKNIAFEIKQGDRVGIIGRNGAGKSTLLKILSRITEPTEGRVKIKGRVASLLEVGTGFHPELTGRENIFLNGAILGMGKAEIKKKFDEIVAFAEVEKFLDTPVKRYSSGMYVRLAFAVAAHLEPEILVVDEVLAVGDSQFQKKCLGKMEDVSKGGRTVLFVSHNMSAIQTLCSRGILLDRGRMKLDEKVDSCIKTHFTNLEKSTKKSLLHRLDRQGLGEVKVSRIDILGQDSGSTLYTGNSVKFIIYLTKLLPNLSCVLGIYDYLGTRLMILDSSTYSKKDLEISDNSNKFVCQIDELLLTPGKYSLNILIKRNSDTHDHIQGAKFFEVEQKGLRDRTLSELSLHGTFLMPHSWVKPLPN